MSCMSVIRIGAVTALWLLCEVCCPLSAANRQKVVVRTEPADRLSANDRLRFNYFFLEAVRQREAGHDDAAFDLLEHARHIDPQAAEVYYLQALNYSQMKQDTTALKYLEKAAQLQPNNQTYLEELARFYIASQQYAKATEAYEQLAERNHKSTDALHILVQLYGQQKRYDKMIATLQRLETQEGSSEQLVLSKVRVYELMGNKKASYQALKKLADDHPNDPMYRTMLGNWLMQNDRRDEAYKNYMSVLKDDPENNYTLSSLYDYYVAVGNAEEARKLLDKLLLTDKTPLDTKAALMRQFIMKNEQAGGDSTQVLRLFDRILAQRQKNADMAELRAAYMTLKKMPADSLEQAYRQVLAIAPDNSGARLQLIQSRWARKDFDGVIALCKPAQQYNPDEVAFYYFSGLAHYQKKEEDEALKDFRQGVSQINSGSNPEIVSDFYAIMGDILHAKGLRSEAYQAYDSCLQWKDDNIVCLNNYAYYLCEDGRQLGKAEEMSRKVIDAEPQNATYLDTFAWIVFLEERYAEAKTYIDKAMAVLDSTQNNGVILEHAGDIYAMNGLLNEAVEYWREATRQGNKSVALAAKIKWRKYFTIEQVQQLWKRNTKRSGR